MPQHKTLTFGNAGTYSILANNKGDVGADKSACVCIYILTCHLHWTTHFQAKKMLQWWPATTCTSCDALRCCLLPPFHTKTLTILTMLPRHPEQPHVSEKNNDGNQQSARRCALFLQSCFPTVHAQHSHVVLRTNMNQYKEP